MSIWWVSAPSETRLTAVIEAASGVCTLIGEPYEAVDGTDVIVGRGPLNRYDGEYVCAEYCPGSLCPNGCPPPATYTRPSGSSSAVEW